MPASESRRIASSRRSGAAARGSIARASLRSSVVTESPAAAIPISAISPRMSASRSISAPLVRIATGWRKSCSTRRIARMIASFFSIGW